MLQFWQKVAASSGRKLFTLFLKKVGSNIIVPFAKHDQEVKITGV